MLGCRFEKGDCMWREDLSRLEAEFWTWSLDHRRDDIRYTFLSQSSRLFKE